MRDVTTSDTPLATREFLTYLERANATNELADTIAAIVERRRALARLEHRRAS